MQVSPQVFCGGSSLNGYGISNMEKGKYKIKYYCFCKQPAVRQSLSGIFWCEDCFKDIHLSKVNRLNALGEAQKRSDDTNQSNYIL